MPFTVSAERAYREAVKPLAADPVLFCEKVLHEKPWSRSAEVMAAVRDHRFVAVKSGHKVAKTWTAARVALWFLICFPRSVVITTAASERQVNKQIWRELREATRKAQTQAGLECELLETEVRMFWEGQRVEGWYAIGFATNDPTRLLGFSGEHLLVVFDEAGGGDVAQGLTAEMYEAAMSLMGAEHSRFLILGNPVTPSGPFYDAFASDLWHKMTISSLESPNVVQGKTLIRGMATRSLANDFAQRYGAESPIYAYRILGEFPQQGSDALLPLEWYQTALRRPSIAKGVPKLGVDVARTGNDETVFVVRDDATLLFRTGHKKQSLMTTAGVTVQLAERFKVKARDVFIDDSGVGGGVTDRLRELHWGVTAVIAGARADDAARFHNKRAECLWRAAQAFNPQGPDPFALPGIMGDKIGAQLTAMRVETYSSGQMMVETKDKIRARIGRSPDDADAFALTFARGKHTEPRVWVL